MQFVTELLDNMQTDPYPPVLLFVIPVEYPFGVLDPFSCILDPESPVSQGNEYFPVCSVVFSRIAQQVVNDTHKGIFIGFEQDLLYRKAIVDIRIEYLEISDTFFKQLLQVELFRLCGDAF